MYYNPIDLIVIGGSFILIGSALTWLLRKSGVKITTERMIYLVILGTFLMLFSDYSFLLFLGVLLNLIAVALFMSHRYITIPNKEKAAEFERILLKAKSGLLNEDEAYELFKKASHYEAKGLLSEAKYHYELVFKSNTSFSVDAESCLKNPLLKKCG